MHFFVRALLSHLKRVKARRVPPAHVLGASLSLLAPRLPPKPKPGGISVGSAAGAELGQDGATSAPLCSAPTWGVNPPVSFWGTDCLVPARVRGPEVEVPRTRQARRELDKKRLCLALKKKKGKNI